MKLFCLIIWPLLAQFALAEDSGNDAMKKALEELRKGQEESMADFKEGDKDWNKLPNEDYQKFFSEWSNKSLEEEMELRDTFCKKDSKLCLSEKDKEGLRAQTRVAIRVVELRNEYAGSYPSEADQAMANQEIERAANVNLCQHHNRDCEKLSAKDRDLVEKLKQRDARIAGMEAEFAAKNPKWKEQKSEKDVLDFLVRKEKELLSLNLELNRALCQKYANDKEFCLEASQLAELSGDTDKLNCQYERVHQLYNLTKEDEAPEKEKILLAGHGAQWDSLEDKDCKKLLAQDRMGESLAPAPVVAPVEEVFGENEDEKNPTNYKAETCEWVQDLPRRVSYLPGCTKKGVCNGYVVCEQKEGGGKFVRISTCGPENCGSTKKDAVNCTKQPRYHSKKAKDETREFVSERLKRILSSGAVEQ